MDPASAPLKCDLKILDVDLKALVAGGTGTFEWWDESEDNPKNLEMHPGEFILFGTDANGCYAEMSFVITTMTSECIPNVLRLWDARFDA